MITEEPKATVSPCLPDTKLDLIRQQALRSVPGAMPCIKRVELLRKYILDKDKDVSVYRNLRRNCWSIKQDGLVKARPRFVSLIDAKFRVQDAGRRRVLSTGVKNVHAYIVGKLVDYNFVDTDFTKPQYATKVTYNPFVYPAFLSTVDGSEVHKAREVLMDVDNGVFCSF